LIDRRDHFLQCLYNHLLLLRSARSDRRDKIADYLLNAAHPDNGGKAAFFEKLGVHRSEPETLAKALQKLASQAEITESAASPHGEKYVIVGQVEAPTGKAANVQTAKAFGVNKGWDVARLVTAYPHKV
jgi:hypothetical protein